MNVSDLVNKYINLGYEYSDAESKVSQDIILIKHGHSKYNFIVKRKRKI